MKRMLIGTAFACALAGMGMAAGVLEEGFVSLFNGKDLSGWTGATGGYAVENGVLFCKEKSGGKLLTEKQYDNFILRFEFLVQTNSNNGLGIRCPAEGDAAYNGMELQILDDSGPKYTALKPYQYHGSIYGVVPAKRGHQKKVGMWNFQEVRAIGSRITVILNGEVIVDADLSTINETMDGKPHPGLRNTKGHIAWLGHGSRVDWRHIRIKEVPADYTVARPTDNRAPEGFTLLFNGKDMTNWKGVTREERFDNPLVRQQATPEKRAAMQKKADELARKHWHIRDQALYFDGKGYSLATAKDYGDFEMWVDWRLLSVRGDSGLYLRGSPQVQIWDAHNQWNIGSGGLYNNKKNPSKALKIADRLPGEWNTFYIKMVGERVTVKLNGELVVDNTVLENFWDRSKPVFPKEQIELQCHGDPLEFKNIYIREL
ncbi:MAG TPA: DUF1080 domain-containing protein [Kiritimatiellia bacterium]|jgi:hypothetical protein|nr:DUF1080 domain-containing protein [Kiritimatiellia bacterium]HOM59113.1 DUF1080 domain-containing protein [Kiritimatiellia bacterium]HOR97020.1 DUF1080 domain-containing protein [Kiritimatiellia bacterium]HPW75410.1 DUF1080 domain-containing protein [Kiritimatiellia bacterium]HRU18885.1 DUF1080 domain-containing protein [Kiritimatiellia bacterium]